MKLRAKLIHEVRAIKSKTELGHIVKAQRISEKVLLDVLPKLRLGVSEIQISDLIKKSFVDYGAPIFAFPPIVAFGKNTANIHHEPTKAKLKKGDIVMFDIGTTVKHFCSDMTRTYFFGEPNRRQKEIYIAVSKAQELAMRVIERGERHGGRVDKIARSFLARQYPNNFTHGLGHGVGTVIHEWPFFSPKSKDIIPVGCVMTVEPGLYFRGFGGVRIEDMILITKKGYKLLTGLKSDLQSVILKVR